MRKIAIGILASDEPIYVEFKELWLRNINKFKLTKYGEYIDFYFLYSCDGETKTNVYEYCNYVDYCHENASYLPFLQNGLTRTLGFYEYIVSNHRDEYTYVMRTGISMCFHLMYLVEWIQSIPLITNLISGTVNPISATNDIFLSGGDMLFSIDVLNWLCENSKNLNTTLNEDVCISHFVLHQYQQYQPLNLLESSRLDFSIMGIEPHNFDLESCHRVHCFRFKTKDRSYDIALMEKLISYIYSTWTESTNESQFMTQEFINKNDIAAHMGYAKSIQNMAKIDISKPAAPAASCMTIADMAASRADQIVPIHERNPPDLHGNMIIFNHCNFLEWLAHWIKPYVYVEYGVASGDIIEKMALHCKQVYGVDINAYTPRASNIEFVQCSTRDFKLLLPDAIDMAFIDADHNSSVAFEDFEDIFPNIIPNGFICIHDTYPTIIEMTDSSICEDSWKVPEMIKQKYVNPLDGSAAVAELITLPFCPGLTIVRKIHNLLWMTT
jgi:hypothetical protein